ncbi:DUF1007 family protein [Dongshaea marina]|uniref:DUF1007 family protein n=1 Tax=Dongshaea marina TaxID=2047966 RepID=UPI00131ED7A6|nr:DUF1007 family protein [Dongshaea marina]
MNKAIKLIMPIALLVMSGYGEAHPHSWIELHTRFIGSPQGKLTALHYTWVFDEMTSAYTLDGEDLTPEHRAQTLKKLADFMVGNMSNDHYFSYLYDQGKPVKYRLATNPQLTYQDHRLALSFTLPLAHPMAMQGKSVELQIYEPGYYVDMSYATGKDIQLNPSLQKLCHIKRIPADPDPKLVAYASSLDANQQSDQSLGRYFAERVVLDC